MRRFIAILLAIVMLVGNVPVQAFAAESEPQETTPCAVEGCTYGAGHSGECSTFVACGNVTLDSEAAIESSTGSL